MEDVSISSHLKDVGHFYINSFNSVIKSELHKGLVGLNPVFTDKDEIKISISNAFMKQMSNSKDRKGSLKDPKQTTVYPSEARLRASTYYAELHIELSFQKENDKNKDPLKMLKYSRTFYVPVMVKSDLCFLNGLSDQRLVEVKEDINDPGGYFIVKGKERLFRQFVIIRRNFPFAVVKNKYKSSRDNYSKFGVFIRSVKDETTFSHVSLHFLTDGTYEVRLYHNSAPYHIPLMLFFKALVDKNDISVCNDVMKYSDTFPISQLKNMLRSLHTAGVHCQMDAKKYLGQLFHEVVNLPRASSFAEVAEELIKKSLLVHLENFEDKFEFLCFSLCKLYSVVLSNFRLDDLDNPANQEILSCGQIYGVALKLGVLSYLKSVKSTVNKSIKSGKFKFEESTLEKCCNRAYSFSAEIASNIATGNLPRKRLHGFPSETGYTIPLKRTNVFEITSQFTAICKFSMEHYSKDMRRFYPEAWGFLCPTQTQEGEKCGLTNYLASQCKIVKLNEKKIEKEKLYKLGVLPCDDPFVYFCYQKHFVFVDGYICGFINSILANKFIDTLTMKRSFNEVPYHTELVLITQDQHFFPGIFVLSSPCRLVRKILHNSKEEFIGCFEQSFSKEVIDITIDSSISSYSEINTTQFLSLSAAMIPFLENNPAVRNIFSSVKCKQALSFPFMNQSGRSDTKFMQLMYGQTPLVSCKLYTEAGFQDYPHGANLIIAVLSYSGFDMEDAIALNRSSVDRGLFHNVVFKTTFYDFEDLANELDCNLSEMEFRRNDDDPQINLYLDEEGLPYVGRRIFFNDPILSVYSKKNSRWLIKLHLERSVSYIYSVKLTGDIPSESGSNVPKNSKKVSITVSKMQIPVVGDKFSNRHGGKGICSVLMNSEDLPFTADGTVPDILFNPHGLPSRMSVGMLLEILSAKLAAIQGRKDVVEPFTYKYAYKTIGEGLMDAGYDYYGKEKFYSGSSGEELEADVYCGCLYYLRFHHFVEEKCQVQSVGPVDERTYQPINPGRSGAIRFGEMERDAILSHGAAMITLDRLLLSSDNCNAFLCSSCHMLLYPTLQNPIPEARSLNLKENKFCRLCHTESAVSVQIPYVLIYLIVELAVVGIKVKMSEE